MENEFLDNLPELELPGGKGKHKKKKSPPLPEPENIVIEYVKIQCPKCGSFKVPVYDSNHWPIRYHKCSACGLCFKSVEKK